MSRFCAVSDAIRMTLDARWRKRELTYAVVAYVLDPATQDAAIARAWGLWTEVADFAVRQVPKAEAATADILIGVGRGPRSNFDGPSGTLAWAELPPGNDQQLLMRFDGDERWTAKFLQDVFGHEAGHLLGLDHDTDPAAAWMDATYNPAIDRPQPNDVNRIQSLYGPARHEPTPPAPPSPPQPPPTSPGGSLMESLKSLRSMVERLYKLSQWIPGNQPDAALKSLLDVIDLILGIPGFDTMTEAQLKTLLAEKLKA